MVGTLFNTVAVAVGASTGLLLGARWSGELRDKMFLILGLFTLAIGIPMLFMTHEPIDLFLALLLGTLVGHFIGIQTWLDKRFQKNIGDPNAASSSGGFVEALMLFCVGSMTLIGCMQDGLENKPDTLFIKGTMDFISSAFLAATLGRGVLFSALGVLGIQGALTVAFMLLGREMDLLLIDELTALGGVLMLGIGLQLIGIKPKGLVHWPLVDALPAFAILPLVQLGHKWLAC